MAVISGLIPFWKLMRNCHMVTCKNLSFSTSAAAVAAALAFKRPLKGLIRPFKGLIRPFNGLIRPFKGLIRPLKGLIRPFKSLIRPFKGLIRPFIRAL